MRNLITDLNNDKKRISISIIATIIFYLFAHGYRFSNNMFSGDSLLMIYQNDYAWQIALGRCFQPIWLFIRGSITTPWLILFMAMCWIGLSVYLVADLLKINNSLLLVFLAALMSVNTALICTNATFLPWSDLFAFALFLAVYGVWLINQKNILLNVIGVISISLSLGTYQAYICVSIALVMILVLRDLYQGNNFSEEWKRVVKFAISLLIAGAIYYVCWKIFQRVFNIWTSDSYNGLAGLGDYSDVSVIQLITLTYNKVLYFLWNPDVFVTLFFREKSLAIVWVYILRVMNIFTFAIIAISLIYLNKKNKTRIWQCTMQAVIVVLFPIGINIVCIISKGMVHTLMIYSFIFIYIMALTLTSDVTENISIYRYGIIIVLALICWVNAVYANQVYLKKQLQEEASKALMNRIVTSVEAMEGYEAGVTKVSIIGSFEQSPELVTADGFEDLLPYGMGNTSMFYPGTDVAILKYVMNVNMNLVSKNEIEFDEKQVSEMPFYPSDNSVKYIGDTIVVKISNLY